MKPVRYPSLSFAITLFLGGVVVGYWAGREAEQIVQNRNLEAMVNQGVDELEHERRRYDQILVKLQDCERELQSKGTEP